jgi:5'(3')-deoxyribonucleotidase
MRTILLDADGVLLDFVGATLKVTHELTSLRFRREDLTGWEIFDYIKDPLVPDLARQVRRRIARKGFCEGIKPIAGAQAGVERLKTLGKVKVVTAPWKTSPTWCYERFEALEHYFGIAHEDVIFAADKSVIHGQVLVDDKPSNVTSWLEHQARATGRPILGVIWENAHNRFDIPIGPVRTNSWDQLANWVNL